MHLLRASASREEANRQRQAAENARQESEKAKNEADEALEEARKRAAGKGPMVGGGIKKSGKK